MLSTWSCLCFCSPSKIRSEALQGKDCALFAAQHLLPFRYLTKIIMKCCYFSTCMSKTLKFYESTTRICRQQRLQPVWSNDWAHQMFPLCYSHPGFVVSLLFINLYFWPLYQYFFLVNLWTWFPREKAGEAPSQQRSQPCTQCTYGFCCVSHCPNDS